MKEKPEKGLFPTLQPIHTELPPIELNIKGLPPLEVKLSIGDESFPKQPLERCHLRWERLFSGVWNALNRYDPKITLGLLQALKQFGLADDIFPSPLLLYERNPSDELLRRVSVFEKLAHIPYLRGIRHPETRYDPFFALHDYSVALFGLRNYRAQGYRNPSAALKTLHERIEEILPRLYFVHRKEISKALLNEWIRRPNKELAAKLTAHLHGLSVSLLRKRLSEARHKYPGYAKLWEHGYDYTGEPVHKKPTLEELETIKREIEARIEKTGGQIDKMTSWLHRSVLEAIQHYKK
jgi:hypothetical protein